MMKTNQKTNRPKGCVGLIGLGPVEELLYAPRSIQLSKPTACRTGDNGLQDLCYNVANVSMTNAPKLRYIAYETPIASCSGWNICDLSLSLLLPYYMGMLQVSL